MHRLWRILAYAACGVFLAHPVKSEETWVGRWASDPAACNLAGRTLATAPLIATESALRWFADTCRIGKIYKIGQTVHIQAHCFGDENARAIPVALTPRGDRLAVAWGKAPVEELRRCR